LLRLRLAMTVIFAAVIARGTVTKQSLLPIGQEVGA
jgi:hypothetical protein